MIICQGCRAEQINGSLFCSECGSDLQNPAVPTLNLPDNSSSEQPHTLFAPVKNSKNTPIVMSEPPVSKPRATPGVISQQPPARRGFMSEATNRYDLKFLILNTGRTVECPDKDNVIIGRSDQITGDMPEIDLAADNALGLGVSRRHACITFREGRPFLIDLGSLNRTWLNRQIMMRGQPYPLNDGDEIRLGNAILKVVYNP